MRAGPCLTRESRCDRPVAGHDLTPAQVESQLRKLADGVEERALPDAVKRFLLTLRRYQLCSGEGQEELLRFAVARAGERLPSDPKKRASEQFTAARWKGTSVEKGYFPTKALVEVVAEHYAATTGQDAAEVRHDLLELRTGAWAALCAVLASNQETVRRDGRRSATPVEFDTACADRDQARSHAESLSRQLHQAHEHIDELHRHDLERSRTHAATLDQHTRRLTETEERYSTQLADAQTQIVELLADRERTHLDAETRITAAETRAQEAAAETVAARDERAVWETQAMTLLVKVDQLVAELTEVRQRLADADNPDGSVRQAPHPDHTDQPVTCTDTDVTATGRANLAPNILDAETNVDVLAVRAERDAALHQVTEARQQLAELEGRYGALEQVTRDRSRAVELLSLERTDLLTEAIELRTKITTLEDTLKTSETHTVGLAAQVDQLTARIEDLQRLVEANGSLTDTQSARLIPGVPDQVVQHAISTMCEPGISVKEAQRRCGDLPRQAWLHLGSLGLSHGILVPGRKKQWEPGSSSKTLAIPMLLLIIAISSVLVFNSAAETRWLVPVLLLGGVTGLASLPKLRRHVTGTSVFALVAAGVAYAAWSGLEATSLDIIASSIYSIFGVTIAATVSAVRADERCLDEIVRYERDDPCQPSEALLIAMENAAQTVQAR